MNLGSQATIAEADPPNLYHLVFSNGMHEVNGMHPIQSRDKLDFAVIALGCGYRDAADRAEADGLGVAFDRLFASPGSSSLSLAVVPGERFPREYGYIHSAKARERFRSALNSR